MEPARLANSSASMRISSVNASAKKPIIKVDETAALGGEITNPTNARYRLLINFAANHLLSVSPGSMKPARQRSARRDDGGCAREAHIRHVPRA